MPSCRATPGPSRVCVSTNSVLTARAFHGPAGQPLPSELPEGSGTLVWGDLSNAGMFGKTSNSNLNENSQHDTDFQQMAQ